MASSSWSLDLSDGRHVVELDYGTMTGRTAVRVDGHMASKGNQSLQMGFNRGVDVPITVGRHSGIVSIRQRRPRSVMNTGYVFALSIDGTPVPGSEPISPLRGGNPGARLIETMAWASAGGGVIGLSQGGDNPTASLFLLAPVACSVVTRRKGLSTRTMALICLGILILGVIVVAVIGGIVRES
jgi:hypothetical protein